MTGLVLLLVAVAPHRLDSRRESGAEGCPDEQAVQRAVAERLGSSPFSSDASRTVSLRWRFSSGVYTSEVTVTNEAGATVGSKKLTSSSADCSELASSTALALALILDPMSLTRPAPPAADPADQLPPPPPPPQLEPEPAPPVVVAAPPIVIVERPPTPPTSLDGLWLGGGAGVSVFETPNVSAALNVDVAGKWSPVMFGGRLSFTAPGSLAVEEGSVWAAVFGVGPFLCVGSNRVGGCLSTRVGAVHAWASGFAAPVNSGTAFALAASVGPYLDFHPLDALKLRLFANGSLQTVAAILMVRNREVWRTPIFAFTAGVSVFGSP